MAPKREAAKIELADKVNQLISARHNQIFMTHGSRSVFASVTISKLPNTGPAEADKGPGGEVVEGNFFSYRSMHSQGPPHPVLPVRGRRRINQYR